MKTWNYFPAMLVVVFSISINFFNSPFLVVAVYKLLLLYIGSVIICNKERTVVGPHDPLFIHNNFIAGTIG